MLKVKPCKRTTKKKVLMISRNMGGGQIFLGDVSCAGNSGIGDMERQGKVDVILLHIEAKVQDFQFEV